MQKQRLAVKNLFLRAAMLTAFVFAQAAAPVIAATDVDLNPQRIAILRWHGANQSGPQVPVGTSPSSLAFDGANIWVANIGNNTLSKL